MLSISGIDALDAARHRPKVVARAIISSALIDEGWTTEQVASVFGKSHPTIIHYKHIMKDIRKTPGYKAERELLASFKNALETCSEGEN